MSLRAASPGRLRSLVGPVYVPTLLFALGQGAVIPVLALAARELGASVAFAGLVVALRGVGVLVCDVPAGWLVARWGERRAMGVGTLVVAGSLGGASASTTPLALALCTFGMGGGGSIWLLARLSFVAQQMPAELRGRALATLGGVTRLGHWMGPFLGAAAVGFLGLQGAYLLHLASAVLALGALWRWVPEGEVTPERGEPGAVSFVSIVRAHAGTFLTGGGGVAALGALRATRQGAIPLWADHLGLGVGEVSVLYGLSLGMESLLFYPAGSAMDRLGRKWVALPCLGLMSLGLAAIPLTVGFGSLLAAALVIGVGNGLGSGLVMTLGTDFAPATGRAQFLGVWRVCSDVGVAGGPLLFSAVTALSSLAVGAPAVAALGALGALLIALRMPETRRAPDAPSRGASGSRALAGRE